ncbi:MAG: acyltransferase domain-containing protein, partial [bacterium]|nr:acyltransferase domain-containing protein [bacterium]
MGCVEHHLIPLSARSKTALQQMTKNLAEHLKQHPGAPLEDTAFTLQIGRKTFEHRSITVASTTKELVETLSSPGSSNLVTRFVKEGIPPVIFMFSGQGSQYVNMGLDLYRREPVFAREMDRCFDILTPIMGESIKEILYPKDGLSGGVVEWGSGENPSVAPAAKKQSPTNPDKINQFTYTSPIKFSFDYSLARLLLSWGIEPYAMIGHSFGEYAAACLSGVLSLEDTLKLAAARGRLMHQMPEGAMMNVPLSETQLQPYLNQQLALAAVNEP